MKQLRQNLRANCELRYVKWPIYIQCCYDLYDNNNNFYNNLYDNNNNLYANKSSKLVIGEFWVSHITYKYGIMFKIYNNTP